MDFNSTQFAVFNALSTTQLKEEALALSMQKEKNPIIVAIMCICTLLDLCLPEGAYACRLTY